MFANTSRGEKIFGIILLLLMFGSVLGGFLGAALS